MQRHTPPQSPPASGSAPPAALVPYEPADSRGRAQAWAALAPPDRRRRAVAACQDHDVSALSELVAGYLLTKGRARAQVSAHTLESYRLSVGILVDFWREENLLHPGADAGDRFVAALTDGRGGLGRGRVGAAYRPATVAARLAGAKALYRALRWAGATTADPFNDVRAPRDPTPRHERRFPYTDAEVAALLEHARGADRALLLLCGHGGLRIAEALALGWAEVDLLRKRLRVRAGKGRKDRTVSMSSSLTEALAQIRPDPARGTVIHTEDGQPYADPTVPRRRLQQLCARAGVTYQGFHSLRHSAGTRLARQTGNLQLVAAHLGHADVSTAAVYAKWSDDSLRQAVNDW